MKRMTRHKQRASCRLADVPDPLTVHRPVSSWCREGTAVSAPADKGTRLVMGARRQLGNEVEACTPRAESRPRAISPLPLEVQLTQAGEGGEPHTHEGKVHCLSQAACLFMWWVSRSLWAPPGPWASPAAGSRTQAPQTAPCLFAGSERAVAEGGSTATGGMCLREPHSRVAGTAAAVRAPARGSAQLPPV